MSESELVNDSFRKFPPISSRLSVDEGTVQRGRMMPKRHNGCTSGPVATKNIRVERKKKRKTVAVNGIPVAGHALTADGTVLDPSAPTELSPEAMADLEMLGLMARQTLRNLLSTETNTAKLYSMTLEVRTSFRANSRRSLLRRLLTFVH